MRNILRLGVCCKRWATGRVRFFSWPILADHPWNGVPSTGHPNPGRVTPIRPFGARNTP